MSQRQTWPDLGTLDPDRHIHLRGSFTIGAAGAVSSQTGVLTTGVTATKDITSSAVGRYLLTFDRTTYKGLVSKYVSMEGPAAGTAFPTTTGSHPQFRNYSGTLAETLAASIQFTRSDTQADADPASGTVCFYDIAVQN